MWRSRDAAGWVPASPAQLGNWIPDSTSMWMGKFCSSLLRDNVSIPQALLFGSNTGLWAISASLHQARVASTVLLETRELLAHARTGMSRSNEQSQASGRDH